MWLLSQYSCLHTFLVRPRHLYRTKTSFCYMYITGYKEAWCLCLQVFPYYLAVIHSNTHKKNPQFMERPNASQKRLLSLFPGSQGITFGSYNPKNKNIKGPENSSSLEIITTSPLHPSTPTQDGRGMKWNSSWSMGTDARRGHTHQSVHSLRRTRALQAAHSSCSC